MAPTVYLEQLEYDTRLMNAALKEGKESVMNLQRLMVSSDTYFDPQALILAPEQVIEISRELVKGNNYTEAAARGGLKALSIIEEAIKNGSLIHDEKEDIWMETLKNDLQSIPHDENAFIEEMIPVLDTQKILLSEYGI